MMNIMLSVISGILLTLCFPKFGLSVLVWIALVPFILALMRSASAKQAVLNGFVFGIVYFGGVLFWLTSISRWVGGFGYIAWVMLVLFQSVYITVFSCAAYLTIRSFHRTTNLILVPFLWAGIEWLRCFGEFGVPGGLVGLTQYQNLPILQFASIAGVFGISFIIVTVNYLAALFIYCEGRFFEKFLALRLKIAFVAVVLVAVYAMGMDRLREDYYDPFDIAVKVALIQPNIDQASKLNPRNAYDMLNLLDFMSRSTFPADPDIIIWPETAVMSFIEKDAAALQKLKDITLKGKCYLLTGGYYCRSAKLYNSVFSVSPDGKIASRYDKQHLVPFGEYLPFKWIAYPILRSTGYFEIDQSGNDSPSLLSVGPLKAGCMICFESLFPDIARQRSKKSDFLLTLTNDAWFGDSAAAVQHLMAAPFRAVENRKYFVQAANTGISAFIDPYGRILKRSLLNERQAMVIRIPLNSVSR